MSDEPYDLKNNCGRCLHRSEKMTGPHCKPCFDAEQPYKAETKFTGFKPIPKEG